MANATRLIMTSNFRPEQGCKGNQILHVESDCHWSACVDHVRNARFVTELLESKADSANTTESTTVATWHGSASTS